MLDEGVWGHIQAGTEFGKRMRRALFLSATAHSEKSGSPGEGRRPSVSIPSPKSCSSNSPPRGTYRRLALEEMPSGKPGKIQTTLGCFPRWAHAKEVRK